MTHQSHKQIGYVAALYVDDEYFTVINYRMYKSPKVALKNVHVDYWERKPPISIAASRPEHWDKEFQGLSQHFHKKWTVRIIPVCVET